MLAGCVLDCRASLGECPVWSVSEQMLYWIDAGAPSLNRFDPATGRNTVWPMPDRIGAATLSDDGRLLVALRKDVCLFDTHTGEFQTIATPEPDLPQTSLNDGRCDRQGRFWIGSLREPFEIAHAIGCLSSIDGCTVRRHASGFVTSNGLAFSPDDRTLYHSDSFVEVRTIWAYDYDIDTGTPTNRRVFVDTHGMGGRPDGAVVDTDGCYWSASNDGWAVIRYTPVGKVDRIVRVPVARPSMPTFGGADLRTLYITSLAPPGTDLRDQPQAGGIFAITLECQGIPEPAYAVPSSLCRKPRNGD